MEVKGYKFPSFIYNGKEVTTNGEISEVIGVEIQKCSGLTTKSKSKLIDGKDIIRLRPDEINGLPVRNISKNSGHGIHLITASGVEKMVDKLQKSNNLNTSQINVQTVEKETKNQKQINNDNVSTSKNISEMINMFVQFMNMTTELIKEQAKQNDKLSSLVEELVFHRISKSNDQEENHVSYSIYKKQINEAVDKVCEASGWQRNSVLSKAYKDLNKEYSIVYEQSKKEFYNELGRGPVNSMELMWFIENKNPVYKNLMLAKLSTLYNDALNGRLE